MVTWKGAAQHFYLCHYRSDSSAAHKVTARRIISLTSAVTRKEAAKQAEARQLVRDLTEILRDLEEPCLSDKTSPLVSEKGSGHHFVSNGEASCLQSAHTYSGPEIETHGVALHNAAGCEVSGTTPSSVLEVTFPDGEWLGREDSLHAEDSWLVDTSSNSQVEPEHGTGCGVKDGCREGGSDRCEVEVGERRALLDAVGGVSGSRADRYAGDSKVFVFESSAEWSQLQRSARGAIQSYRKKGESNLGELRAVCNALVKLRVVRLAQVYSLTRRLREVQERLLRSSEVRRKEAERETVGEVDSPGLRCQGGGGGQCSSSADYGSEAVKQMEDGSVSGSLSLNQIDKLTRKVGRLEAVLAAACQVMSGCLGAMWDELGVSLEGRLTSEAEACRRDVVMRYDDLERRLEEVQNTVALLRPIMLLRQQCDELVQKIESQAATCRDLSKHLGSRKADAASSLRKAEADRKHLLKQHAMVQRQLDDSIKDWERETGKQFERGLHGWPSDAKDQLKGLRKESSNKVKGSKTERFTKKVCNMRTGRLGQVRSSSEAKQV